MLSVNLVSKQLNERTYASSQDKKTNGQQRPDLQREQGKRHLL